MLFPPEEHASNPPETWDAVKVGRTWQLVTKDGTILQYAIRTKRDALAYRESGFYVKLYAEEGCYYASKDGGKS